MAKITVSKAEVVHINTADFSYGIFCYNDLGDLFLNSDWGMYGFAWRSFGADFRAFLAQTNPDYLVGKLRNNYRTTTGKELHKHTYTQLIGLVSAFINHLNETETP